MDYKNLNPCEYEIYARAMAWAETGCWCCTATRAALVALVVGIFAGLTFAGAFKAAAWFAVVSAPLTVAALVTARSVWKDSYEDEETK